MSQAATRASAEVLDRMLIECLCLNLRKAMRSVTRLYDEALDDAGVRSTQLPFLVAGSLRDHTFSSLAEELAVDRTTLSRNIALLERKGWVAVVKGEDRRTRHILVTEGGRAVVDRAVPLWEAAQRRASDVLDERLDRLVGDLQSTVGMAPGR